MSEIIQGLWIGGDLSKVEQLSIKSFIDYGHEYHLYTYGDVGNIPNGTVVKDANEILPKDDIFTYKNGSYSAFSNLFRFTMLYKKGGYWADTDLICVKKITIEKPYVFVSEPNNDYSINIPTSCLIKLPKNSDVAGAAVLIQLEHKKLILSGNLSWGSGPKTIKKIIEDFGLQKYVLDWRGVCSCNWRDFKSILYSDYSGHKDIIGTFNNLPDNMYGIHLWNEIWRRNGLDKNQNYDTNSIFEQLKLKHNIN